MTKSRIKNKCNKLPSRKNFVGLKQTNNRCTNLTKAGIKQYFAKSAEHQSLTHKSFWNSIPPFLTNENIRNDDVFTLKEKTRLINDELEFAETLNSHYFRP